MKTNDVKVKNSILDAIKYCGRDSALEPTKSLLRRALIQCEQITKKRTKRQTILDQINEESKLKYQKWMEQVKENIKKSQGLDI